MGLDAAVTGTRAAGGSEHSSGFSYKPALDGLRAVAVCGVIAFHFGANGFEGGFLGVDTFFVLSGYLITSLLLSEWGRTKGLDFVAFWARRAKRLLPALFLVLIAVGIWARLESSSIRFGTIRGDLLSTLFYGANWHFIQSGQSYFDLVGEPSPLRHAWSLAIEEQFYLLWPLITFAALKLGRGRPRLLAGVCVVGIAASVAVMALVYDSTDPSRAYFGTDARAAQLLVGALLAIVLTRWSPSTTVQRRAVQGLGLVGAAFTVWAFMSITDTDSWMYHGGFLVFAIATAFLIVAIVQPTTSPVGRVLSFRPLRWVGMISYGLYLWHWPVQIFLSESRTGLSDWGLALVRLAATFGIATASYYLVELPIRRGALKGWVSRVAAPAAFVTVAILSVVLTAGIEAQPAFLAAAPETVLKSGPPPSVAPTAPATQVNVGRVLLLGDSVASSLSDGLQKEAALRGIPLSSSTRPGCGMVTGIPASGDGSELPWGAGCASSTLGYLDGAVQESQPNTVLWLSTWETLGRIIDGKLVEFGTPAFDAALLAEFEETREHLTRDGAHVVLITNAPRAEHSDTVFNIPDEESRIEHLNKLYKTFAAQHPDSVTVVDLAAIVCPGGPPCAEFVDGVRLRPRDGGHFEGDGPAWVAPRLLDAVTTAVAKFA